jgi:4-hydroxybenzoate polyprenyltransferase
MNIKNKAFEYLRLIRVQTAAVTAVTPLIGGLIMGLRDIFSLTILFIIGIFYHIYGFVLNEYIDINIDKTSKDLKNKPLVSEVISKRTALFIALFSCAFSCILTLIFFPSVLPLLFILSALLFGGIYDVFGKKILCSDFILGLAFFFLCLMGASTVSYDFTNLTFIVCLIYFVHIVFNNSVEGGLKDVDHDYKANAKTLATKMGAKVDIGKLKVTKIFISYAVIIKIIFIGLVFLLGFQPEINLFSSYDYFLQIILIILFLILVFFTMFRFLLIKKFDRAYLKKMFSIHEMSSYFLVIIVLFPLIGVLPTVYLILIPFCWYIFSNTILYKKLLQPQV